MKLTKIKVATCLKIESGKSCKKKIDKKLKESKN